MPLQDLTPQLRTRLSRIERAVGWFITMATILLIAAFAYYIYQTGKRRGWYETKIPYSTGINNVSGLKVGDPVKLMGKIVGEITRIELNPPNDAFDATVDFKIKTPYQGYVWLDSKVAVTSDLLGGRFIEIMKGYEGAPTVLEQPGKPMLLMRRAAIDEAYQKITKQIAETNTTLFGHEIAVQSLRQLNATIRQNPEIFYEDLTHAKSFWIDPLNTPSLTERLQSVIDTVQEALPNIMSLTNQITTTLTNASSALHQTEITVQQIQPILSNLNVITATLRNPHGSLGEWIIPTNINLQLEQTLHSSDTVLKTANATLSSTDTNITALVESVSRSLDQLADLTSNLNLQVKANTNILKYVSDSVVHTDELIQGLKHHWFLRSAFKTNSHPDAIKSKKKK